MPDLKDDTGKKFDEGKQPWYAMPLTIIRLLADVFAAGEKKYEVFNCLKPFENGDRRLYDAAMRHTVECQIDPLAIDPETGCYHGVEASWNHLMRVYNALQAKKLTSKPKPTGGEN